MVLPICRRAASPEPFRSITNFQILGPKTTVNMSSTGRSLSPNSIKCTQIAFNSKLYMALFSSCCRRHHLLTCRMSLIDTQLYLNQTHYDSCTSITHPDLAISLRGLSLLLAPEVLSDHSYGNCDVNHSPTNALTRGIGEKRDSSRCRLHIQSKAFAVFDSNDASITRYLLIPSE